MRPIPPRRCRQRRKPARNCRPRPEANCRTRPSWPRSRTPWPTRTRSRSTYSRCRLPCSLTGVPPHPWPPILPKRATGLLRTSGGRANGRRSAPPDPGQCASRRRRSGVGTRGSCAGARVVGRRGSAPVPERSVAAGTPAPAMGETAPPAPSPAALAAVPSREDANAAGADIIVPARRPRPAPRHPRCCGPRPRDLRPTFRATALRRPERARLRRRRERASQAISRAAPYAPCRSGKRRVPARHP